MKRQLGRLQVEDDVCIPSVVGLLEIHCEVRYSLDLSGAHLRQWNASGGARNGPVLALRADRYLVVRGKDGVDIALLYESVEKFEEECLAPLGTLLNRKTVAGLGNKVTLRRCHTVCDGF